MIASIYCALGFICLFVSVFCITRLNKTTSKSRSRTWCMTRVNPIMDAFLVLVSFVTAVQGQWIEHTDPPLPRSNNEMAIAYYNQSIYLLYVVLVFVFAIAMDLIMFLFDDIQRWILWHWL